MILLFFRTHFLGVLPASAFEAIGLVSLYFLFFLLGLLHNFVLVSIHIRSVFLFALINDMGFFRLLMKHFRDVYTPLFRVFREKQHEGNQE